MASKNNSIKEIDNNIKSSSISLKKNEDNNKNNLNDSKELNKNDDKKEEIKNYFNNKIEPIIKRFNEIFGNYPQEDGNDTSNKSNKDIMKLNDNKTLDSGGLVNEEEINESKNLPYKDNINFYFGNFLRKMNEKDINSFFQSIDDIKNLFISNISEDDYINLFIEVLLENEKIGNIWKFLNKITMIKIYYDIKNENKLSSFLDEKNYFCKNILFKIIKDFKEEYFPGLYDYIYFEKHFELVKENENKNSFGIYEKYKTFNKDLISNNKDNYLYIFSKNHNSKDVKKSIDQPNSELEQQDQNIVKWNKYINEEYKNFNLKIIYGIFDSLDSKNDNTFRESFYKKIFKMIKKEQCLKEVEFINAIILLIFNDSNYNFQIFSLSNEIELKSIFSPLLKRIIFLGNKKEQSEEEKELLNSFFLFLNLLKTKNIPLHNIICLDLNSNKNKNNENKFIFIEKLFDLYINIFTDLEIVKENLIIIYHSLTQCLIEYTNIKEEIKSNLKEILVKKKDKFKEKKLSFHKNIREKFKEKKNQEKDSNNIVNEKSKKSNQEKNQKNETEEIINKYLFIIKDSLLFEIFCIKILDIKDEFLVDNCLNEMNIYFKEFLYIYKSIIKISDNDDKIREDNRELFKLYKNNKFKNNFLFKLILLYYEKIFYYIESLDLEIYKSFIYIIDENNFEIASNYINDLFEGRKKRLLTLFLFLEKIRDIIEIRKEGKNIKVLNILEPKYFNINKYSKNDFNYIIDYTDRETKLMSIYNYIECIIYNIEINDKTYLNIFEIFFNYYVELLNYFIVLIENICLIDFYSKSTDVSITKYNKIDNRQKFFIFSICITIHGIILFLIIIGWFIFRAKIDFFFSLTKYNNKHSEELIELSLEKKIKYLKEFQLKNFSIKKSKKKIKTIKYFHFNCFKILGYYLKSFLNSFKHLWIIIYSLRNIYPFIITLICLILHLFVLQIFIVFPLIFMFNSFETLFAILRAVFKQIDTILLLGLYMLVILYIFSLFGFFFLPKMFKYESVDNNNEIIFEEENICSSTISCLLYFINYGMISEGSIDMDLISYKNNYGYYYFQFFFKLILYAIIHMIFFNVILATITNSFDEMKQSIMEKNYNKKNVCFICQKTRNDCINDSEDFDDHLFLHNMWKYIIFICKILFKDEKELSEEEYSIYNQMKEGKIDWFPEYKTIEKTDFQKKYKISSLATDAIILRKHKKDNYHDILLIKRKYKPFVGKLALPGGFVSYGEIPKFACIKKIKSLTDLYLKDIELFTVRGSPNRDPRRHVVSIIYLVYVNPNLELNNNDEYSTFYDLKTVLEEKEDMMSFDHYNIIEELIYKKFNDLYKLN